MVAFPFARPREERCSWIATSRGHQPNTNDMKTYKLRIMQNIRRWYSWPIDVEIEATDLATAIVVAWNNACAKGLEVKEIYLLT